MLQFIHTNFINLDFKQKRHLINSEFLNIKVTLCQCMMELFNIYLFVTLASNPRLSMAPMTSRTPNKIYIEYFRKKL